MPGLTTTLRLQHSPGWYTLDMPKACDAVCDVCFKYTILLRKIFAKSVPLWRQKVFTRSNLGSLI